jgi:hypothetical protein
MRELEKALADIIEIRSHIAANTTFRGLGPGALVATGVVPLLTAAGQAVLLRDPDNHPVEYFTTWIAASLLCAAIIGMEMLTRSRRHNSRLADAVIYNAIQQFMPSAFAGVFLGLSVAWFAPEAVWMLPGLWQVLVGLGIFASARYLPGMIAIAGGWYFVAGFAVLALESASHALSPWTMGLPFVIGQVLAAAILHASSGDVDERI